MTWKTIDTAPIGERVFLWWVGQHRPEYPEGPAPPTICIGTVTIYGPEGQVHPVEPKFVWDGQVHLPIEYFTHWAPLDLVPPP